MNRAITWIVVIAAIAALGWFWSIRQDMREVEETEVLPPEKVLPPEPAEPVIEHPVEQIPPTSPVEDEPDEPEPVPLPELEESDEELTALVGELGSGDLADLLMTDAVVSRIVATVDSLTSAGLVRQMLPVSRPSGRFLVLGEGEEVAMSPENAARYQPYVNIATAMDVDRAVDLYRRYYPLFQQAYEDQGYPDAYFNDRLVEVIDHLLAAPEPRDLLPLKQNEAVYEFANERYEELSVGQKLMIRLGRDNEQQVKDKLRELRAAVTGAGLADATSD